ERGFEDEGDTEPRGQLLELAGDVENQAFAFDNTGPRDQEQRLVGPDGEIDQLHLRALSYRHLLLPVRPCRLHEAGEQRMAVAWRRAELGVELAGDEERMRRQLDHLDQAVAREAGETQPRVHHLLQVAVVELVTVAVALLDQVRAVDLVRARAVRQAHFLRAEAHGATHFGLLSALFGRALLVLPFGDQRDHRMRRRAVELGGMRAVQARNITRVLDDREL